MIQKLITLTKWIEKEIEDVEGVSWLVAKFANVKDEFLNIEGYYFEITCDCSEYQ